MPDRMSPGLTPANSQSDAWQEMERALSLVHVAGLELIAEIKANGEQSRVRPVRSLTTHWRHSMMRLAHSGSCLIISDLRSAILKPGI